MADDIAAMYRRAQRALQESRLDEARRLCLALVAAKPDFADGYLLLGIAEGSAGHIGPALQALEKAVRLLPKAECLVQYAKFLILAHQDHRARQFADGAAALRPSDPFTLDTLGCVYSHLGAHDIAAPLFQAAVAQWPNHLQMRCNLASSMNFLGRFDEAAAHYESIIATDPKFVQAHAALSALKTQTPRSNHVARLETVLERLGDDIDKLQIRYALAKEYEDLKDYDAVFRHLDHANRSRKVQLGYQLDFDRVIFDRITQRFQEHDYFQSDSEVSAAPIFIVGLPRTGTTLVDRIVSSHPRVESAGELQSMPIAVKRLALTPSQVVLDPETIDAARRISPTALGQLYLQGAAPHHGTRVRFIDKLPLNFLYIGFIARALPHATIVCLRRHPLDSIWSNYKHLFATNFSYYNYSYDLLDTAAYYVMFDRLLSFWQRLLPGRVLEVQYESILDNLESESRHLIAHCGLDWSADCLRFHENTAPVATPSAAQVRQPIYRGAIGRWRDYERHLAPVRHFLETQGIDV